MSRVISTPAVLWMALLVSGCSLGHMRAGAPRAARASERESWYLKRDSTTEIYVAEIGRGRPVVVLHGGPGADHRYMLGVADGLAGDHRFIFYDQRGSTRSRSPVESITMNSHVEDLEALRSALGVERLDVLSHSAGTLLAYEYLRRYPHRVRNLTLVGALPHKNGRKYFDADYSRLWTGLSDSARAYEERPAVQAEIAAVERDSSLSRQKKDGLVSLIRNWVSLYHIERWRAQEPVRVAVAAARATRASTNFEYDVGPLLAAHDRPVTVINGEYDYTVGPRGSPLWRQLASRSARNVDVVVIPNAGHNVWIDEPGAFATALRRALR
jgi:proline iminopeptidase